MAIVFTLLFFSVSSVFAQEKFVDFKFDETKTYIIKLEDGSQLVGSLLQTDSQFIVIKTFSIPKIDIPIGRIKSIDIVDEANLKNGEFWFPNPNSTRYLFGPSAFTLKKGEGYYQNTYLVLNSVHVGITDHISIGGGLELISTFGAGSPIFFITPKIGFKVTEKFQAGGGILFASTPYIGTGTGDRSSFGIAYGIGTYGTEDHNITGGLGWGFLDGEFSGKPIITISGMTRLSRRTALVTENWIIPTDNYYGLFSYGVRFFGEKMTVDLAFINSPDIAEALIIGIPYVDFVVKF